MKLLQSFVLTLAGISSLLLAATITPSTETLLFQAIEPFLGRRGAYLMVSVFNVGFIYLAFWLLLETKRSLKGHPTSNRSHGVSSDAL
jgi:hypothetical protein